MMAKSSFAPAKVKKNTNIGSSIFSRVVEVMPEFEVENYKGIEVAKKEYNVQEEDIQKELQTTQEKSARMIAIEDRPVKEQDMVIIDYKGSVDDVAFEGGTAEKQSLVIGSGQFIPGFEEQLIGANIGDDIKVNVTFPEDYHADHLAGKEAVFEVKIHEIKEKELPVLDDEFAKDVSEFDTLEELKADIKKKLEEQAQKRAEQELQNEIIEDIVDSVNIDIPNPVVERQIDGMLRDFSYQLSYQGLNLDYYYQMTGTDENALRDQMREDAKSRVKTQLVLEKISLQEKIEASEEEVQEEVEKLAKQYKQEVEDFKANLRPEDLNYFKDNIVVKKTINFLVENAKIS